MANLEKLTYEVKVEPKNGLRIAGRLRAKGDKIELTKAEAEFLLLDGLVELVTPPAPTPARAPKPAEPVA